MHIYIYVCVYLYSMGNLAYHSLIQFSLYIIRNAHFCLGMRAVFVIRNIIFNRIFNFRLLDGPYK